MRREEGKWRRNAKTSKRIRLKLESFGRVVIDGRFSRHCFRAHRGVFINHERVPDICAVIQEMRGDCIRGEPMRLEPVERVIRVRRFGRPLVSRVTARAGRTPPRLLLRNAFSSVQSRNTPPVRCDRVR